MKKLLLSLVAVVVMAGGANADVLWDQSDYDPNFAGMWNAVSGCAPFGGSIHYANDIRVYDMVTVTTITLYHTAFNFDTEATTQAHLYITAKNGPLPIDGVDLPQENGAIVPVTVSADGNGAYQIVADGLSVMLTPGDYWVSLTPIMPAGPWGPDFAIRSMTTWGEAGAWYEYCGQFAPAWGSNIDGFDVALLIEGTIDAVPNEDSSLGQLKAKF